MCAEAVQQKLAVVIPAWNVAKTVAQALDSVFAQTRRDFEVIVVNDGSTDGTAAALAPYREKVRIIDQPNRGFCSSRNLAIRSSHAEYVALLDADDVWLPDKLEKCVGWLEARPDCVLVYTDVMNVDLHGRDLGTSPIDEARAHAPTLDEMLSHLWPIMPSTVVMRRAAFEAAGAFADGVNEDLDFWIRIRERGPFGYIPEKLTRFTFGELYPKVLRRDLRGRLFFRVMRERYGARADGVIRSFTRHHVRMIAHAGVVELSKGNRAGARQCFYRVLRYDPTHVKSYLRLIKTLLPKPMVWALSGRAARRVMRQTSHRRAERPGSLA